MAKKLIEVKVSVQADDVLMAGLMQEGIQNILNELGEANQAYLIELADKNLTRKYAKDILGYLQNPILKKIIGM